MFAKLSKFSYLQFSSCMQRRMFSAQVFVQGLPSEWDEHDVNARFSLTGTLQKVHFVKSATGLKTGKVVITYEEGSSAD